MLRLVDIFPIIDFKHTVIKLWINRDTQFIIKSAHPRLDKNLLHRDIYGISLDVRSMFKREQKTYKTGKLLVELNNNPPDFSLPKAELELIELLNNLVFDYLSVVGYQCKLVHPEIKDDWEYISELKDARPFWHHKVKSLKVDLDDMYYDDFDQRTADLKIILHP